MHFQNIVNLSKLKFTLPSINGGKDTVLITGGGTVRYVYEGDKRTDKIDSVVYPVLIPGLGFSPFTIRIEGEQSPSITDDAFKTADTPLPAKVEGFTGKLYKNRDGEVALSATATAIKLL